MKFFIALIGVSIAVGLSTLADIYLKKSQLENFSFVTLGILLYALGALPVAVAFKLVILVWFSLSGKPLPLF